jgi:hypothetical protein
VKIYLFLFFIFGSLKNTIAQQAPPPWEVFKQLKTPHFEVIYPADQQPLAELTAAHLERAHHLLSQSWPPPERSIPVVLRLQTDLPNGYAALLPYPHIVLYPMAPALQESIGEYQDWLFELSLHELIHIFTFEQRRGLAKNLKLIFGNVLTPNILLPRWWLEGVAVDGESRFSAGGRMRSVTQQGFFRAMGLSPNLSEVTLSSLNEFRILTWPYGNRPYFYGSYLWSQFTQKAGVAAVHGQLHQTTGGRLPYLLDQPLAESLGVFDLDSFWLASQQDLRQKAQQQKDLLSKIPTSVLQDFSSPLWIEAQAPSLSPDGLKLAFLIRKPDLVSSVAYIKRTKKTENFNPQEAIEIFKDLNNSLNSNSSLPVPDTLMAGTIQRLAWSEDSNTLFYDLTFPVNRFETRADIWSFHLEQKKVKQMSKGLSLREPAFNHQTKHIAAVKLGPLGHGISIYNPATKELKKWFYQDHHFAHWPVWINESELIATIKYQDREELWLISATQATPIASDCKRLRFPHRITKNNFLIACDKNQVWNIYRGTLTAHKKIEWQPQSNLITGTGAFDYDPHLKELWLSHLTDKGYQLKTTLPITNATLPLVDSFFEPYEKLPAITSEITTIDQDYKPTDYLWPQYWIPFVLSSDKSTAYMISTSGMDPLSRHTYQASLSWDQVTQATNYSFNYLNQTQPTSFQVLAAKEISFLSDPSQLTEINILGLALDWPLLSTPWYQVQTVVSRQRRQFITAQVNQWEFKTRFQHRWSQSSPLYPIPIRDKSAWLELSLLQPDQPGVQSYLGQFLGQYNFLSQSPYLGVHSLKLRGYYLDQIRSLPNYTSTQSWQIGNTLTGPIMRGYVTGAFFTPKLFLFNYEHWWPSLRIDQGSWLTASYLHQMYFGLVADFIAADGFGYSSFRNGYQRVKLNQVYQSVGFESIFDFNLGFHFDLKFVLGYYIRPASDLGPAGSNWNIGFRF